MKLKSETYINKQNKVKVSFDGYVKSRSVQRCLPGAQLGSCPVSLVPPAGGGSRTGAHCVEDYPGKGL